ncbi:MAG: D-alanine--D-alanine ligase [Candidatus Riflebacteria bacterium]|nr:D-alanine--D-alanine ligase [Candidatus Riflebacteria bacterium]
MPSRIRIGVIYGGRSGEHLVSIASATSLVQSLDPAKYDVVPIGISREGRWLLAAEPARYLESGISAKALEGPKVKPLPGEAALHSGNSLPVPKAGAGVMLADVVGGSLDVAIPLVHGTYGEDGTLQGLLEMAGVPYVGAGVLASAIGMDKIVMKKILGASGIPVADWVGLRRVDLEGAEAVRNAVDDVSEKLGYPCFVKPANGGSSVGMTKVREPGALPTAFREALAYDTRVIVEKGIQCREIECSVIGNRAPEVSLPGEITYTTDYYDYDTKYTPGMMSLRAPAPLDAETTEKVRTLAGDIYRALECEGMARVDMFLENETGRLLANELNTIPGFTSTSVFSKLWEVSGMDYSTLLDRLIELALERFQERHDLAGLK